MKIFLIKNSDIDANHIIEHDNDFSIVEQYLEDKTNYQLTDFNELEPIDASGQQFEQLTFTYAFSFSEGNGGLKMSEVGQINGAVIEDYPFLSGKTYWLIQAKKINASNLCEITFVFHSTQTWGVSKLNLKKPLQLERKHFNYIEQFDDPANIRPTKLKADSIFREIQPSGNIDIVPQKFDDFFKNENELKIIERWKIEKWVVVTVKKDDQVLTIYDENGEVDMNADDGFNILVEPTNDELQNNKIRYKYPNLYINLYVPLLEANPYIPFNVNGKVITVNGLFQLNEIISNPDIYDIKIIDGPPTNKLRLNKNDEIEGFDLYAKVSGSGGEWFVERVISKDNTQLDYSPKSDAKSNQLYDFELPNRNYNHKRAFQENQILELNFEPYKYFTFEFFSEVVGTGWRLTNNQLKQLPRAGQVLFKRNFNYAPYSLEYIDELDIYFGTRFNKTKRSILMPSNSDSWKEYNQQKIINASGDFMKIASGTASGAVSGFSVGGGVGAMIGSTVGAGLSIAGTILNRESIKQTPDVARGSATEINTEALSGYDSKSITIYEPIASQKKKLAYEFHREGLWCNHFNFEVKSVSDLLPKDRFNYLKLSFLASIDVVKNDVDDIYRKEYLESYQNGITLWNWKTDGREFIFDYTIKNPDRNNNMIDETILYDGDGIKEQTHNFTESINNFQFLEIKLYDNDGEGDEYINIFVSTNNLIGPSGAKSIWTPCGIRYVQTLSANIRLTPTTIYHTAITSTLSKPWLVVKGINRVVAYEADKKPKKALLKIENKPNHSFIKLRKKRQL